MIQVQEDKNWQTAEEIAAMRLRARENLERLRAYAAEKEAARVAAAAKADAIRRRHDTARLAMPVVVPLPLTTPLGSLIPK